MPDRPRGDWDCAGVARDTYKQRQQEREESQKPQPWILQKLVVGVVLGIIVWTYYVYVGRICIKLLNRGDTVKGGLYIAIFNLFFLMFGWTYLKVIITPPGFARDHVPQCEPPGTTQYGRPWDIDSEVRGTDDGHRTIGTAYEGMSERGHGRPISTTSRDPTRFPPDTEAGTAVELDAIPPIACVHARIASPVGDDYPLGDASTTGCTHASTRDMIRTEDGDHDHSGRRSFSRLDLFLCFPTFFTMPIPGLWVLYVLRTSLDLYEIGVLGNSIGEIVCVSA
ncbi:hypothetical protein RSAG8_01935, partial [Rhizoctonia solani AG-8 WAC10335]